MKPQRLHQPGGEGNVAVLVALAGTDQHPAVFEVHVLDAQPQTFRDPQATAVEDAGSQLGRAFQATEQRVSFGPAEDGGQSPGPGNVCQPAQPAQRTFEHMVVEEEQGAQGLVVGGSGNPTLDGKVGQEFDHLGFGHLGGVTFTVVQDKTLGSPDVDLLGAIAEAFQSEHVADLIE